MRSRRIAAVTAVLCLALAGVIGASSRLGCGVGVGPLYVGLGRGLVSVQHPIADGFDASWRWWRYEDKPLLWAPVWMRDPYNIQVLLPLWPVGAALGAIAVWLARPRRAS